MSKSKLSVKSYKEFYIVKYTDKVTYDVVNPHNGKLRVVKSEQAAKWRITRAVNLAEKVRKLV